MAFYQVNMFLTDILKINYCDSSLLRIFLFRLKSNDDC